MVQIPELAADVSPPPWCEPGGPCNAWIGTAGAATPLHFDSYDNLLAQARLPYTPLRALWVRTSVAFPQGLPASRAPAL